LYVIDPMVFLSMAREQIVRTGQGDLRYTTSVTLTEEEVREAPPPVSRHHNHVDRYFLFGSNYTTGPALPSALTIRI
jgi:hypothetical protein